MWNKGTVVENDDCKLSCHFEYHLHKTKTKRQTDVTIEYKSKNKIFLVDMDYPSKNNADVKHAKKLQKISTTVS